MTTSDRPLCIQSRKIELSITHQLSEQENIKSLVRTIVTRMQYLARIIFHRKICSQCQWVYTVHKVRASWALKMANRALCDRLWKSEEISRLTLAATTTRVSIVTRILKVHSKLTTRLCVPCMNQSRRRTHKKRRKGQGQVLWKVNQLVSTCVNWKSCLIQRKSQRSCIRKKLSRQGLRQPCTQMKSHQSILSESNKRSRSSEAAGDSSQH